MQSLSILFQFYIYRTYISIFMPRSTKASCCFFPHNRGWFLIRIKGPELKRIKASLASSSSHLTEEPFAFTIKYELKMSVSVYFNLRKQVKQHSWVFPSPQTFIWGNKSMYPWMGKLWSRKPGSNMYWNTDTEQQYKNQSC